VARKRSDAEQQIADLLKTARKSLRLSVAFLSRLDGTTQHLEVANSNTAAHTHDGELSHDRRANPMGAYVATAGVVVFLIATFLDWVSTDQDVTAPVTRPTPASRWSHSWASASRRRCSTH
jgi:hypothetical protein